MCNLPEENSRNVGYLNLLKNQNGYNIKLLDFVIKTYSNSHPNYKNTSQTILYLLDTMHY